MSTNTDVSSLVVLTVVADNLTFIVAESDGEIVSLSILEFESGNKGELEVVVRSKVSKLGELRDEDFLFIQPSSFHLGSSPIGNKSSSIFFVF